MGTGSFPGVKCGRGVLLTTHPLLVPRSLKSRAIPLPTFWATPARNGITLPTYTCIYYQRIMSSSVSGDRYIEGVRITATYCPKRLIIYLFTSSDKYHLSFPPVLSYVLKYSLTPSSRVLEKLTGSQSSNSPHSMEPEGSLPHSQVPATFPYPEPARSSPCPHFPLPEDPS